MVRRSTEGVRSVTTLTLIEKLRRTPTLRHRVPAIDARRADRVQHEDSSHRRSAATWQMPSNRALSAKAFGGIDATGLLIALC
jgi:hypothetical protein